MSDKKEQILLLVTIVERRYGNVIIEAYKKHHVIMHQVSSGHGSASSEVLESLGIGSSEKDIVFSFARANDMSPLLDDLGGELGRKIGCLGIAFLLPVVAINQLVAAVLTMQNNNKNRTDGGVKVAAESEKKNSLILITVDHGYTDEVMETARKAGATGGTILRTRWVGSDQFEQFHGITFQEEREMLMIVSDISIRNKIMESVNAKHGLTSDAHAVLCSLPVDKMFWLS